MDAALNIIWNGLYQFGFELVVLAAAAVIVWHFRSRFQRQLKGFVADMPGCLFIIDSQSGQLLEANRQAMQLLSIRKIGRRFHFPGQLPPRQLARMFTPFTHHGYFTNQGFDLTVSESVTRHLILSGRLDKYEGHKAWFLYAETAQQSQGDNELASNQLASRVLNSMSEPVFFLDMKGESLGTNRAYDHFWQDRTEQGFQAVQGMQPGRYSQRRWTTTPDGRSCLLETHVSTLTDDRGQPLGSLGISHDVTDWHQTQQALRDEMERRKDTEVALAQRDTILQSILEASPDPIGMFNESMIYEACNKPFVESLGITDAKELLGQRLDQVVAPDNYLNYKDSDEQVMRYGRTLRYIRQVEKTLGEPTWYDVVKSPYQDPASGTNGVLVIARDVSERFLAERKLARANQELEHLSFIDGLTKVANRRRFDAQLETLWRLHVRQKQPLTLMLCDIDFFKDYNDNYGHLQGDEALIQVAKAFSQELSRDSDFVARYGGEEFAFLLPNTDKEGAEHVARRIHEAIAGLNIAHHHSGVARRITLSLGSVSCVPEHGSKGAEMVALADKALYQAKENGRNRSEFS